MTSGNIILLNGTSSSGKTTIAKALQLILPEPYYLFSGDLLQPGFPPGVFNFTDRQSSTTVKDWEIIFQDGRLQEVRVGPGVVRFLTGMYRAVAAFASAGNHMIVDDVIYHPDIFHAAVTELHNTSLLFVGVYLPLEVAEQRERERGDRALGGARAFYEGTHVQKLYDLVVNTATTSPQECAVQIKNAIEDGNAGSAFKELWRRMNADNSHD